MKGFTEALMEDLAVNAPHGEASVVMPGHVGTGIAENTLAATSDGDVSEQMKAMAESFRHNAPTSADEAVQIILDAVLAREWRILVGDDAAKLDSAVRADPVSAYAAEFMGRLL
ncbi:MAG: hypothetical protein ACI91O_001432 [Candidatus Poriferisodalaceae bacterium]